MRSNKGLRAAITVAALAVVMMMASGSIALAIKIDTSVGVTEENCTSQCHGSMWGPTKMAAEINFSHGYHTVYQCSSCHGTRFVHSQNSTIKPDMKLCWSCHGLQHGPQGEMATSRCEACHKTPVSKLRLASHIAGWAGKAHAGPGASQLRTSCMMCHTHKQCEDCHRAKGVSWEPKVAWSYDAGDACMQCHGMSTLRKEVGMVKNDVTTPLEKSFQVVGLDFSVHRNLTCGACHSDFSYVKSASATDVWTVTASQACAGCHKAENKVYSRSIHGQQLAKGDLTTATCASCHGSHEIQNLKKSPVAKAALRASAQTVCAQCHAKQYASYDDYYHGAAYKRGAADAPVCWDCHGAHDIAPAKDPNSKVSDANIGKTCGKCHQGSQAEFGQQAKTLIHQQRTVYNDNVIVRLIAAVRGMLFHA